MGHARLSLRPPALRFRRDLDYRFNANSQLYVKGLWSRFDNYGTNYIYDVAGTPTPGAEAMARSPARR